MPETPLRNGNSSLCCNQAIPRQLQQLYNHPNIQCNCAKCPELESEMPLRESACLHEVHAGTVY